MIVTGAHATRNNGEKHLILNNATITRDGPSCQKIQITIPGLIRTYIMEFIRLSMAAETESHAAAIGGVTTMMRSSDWEDHIKNCYEPGSISM